MKRFVKLLALAGATLITMASCCNNSDKKNAEAVLENIASRTAIRQFTPEAVSEEQIETLLKAAMAAPSALNRQPWRFVVITDRDKLASMAVKMPYSRLDTAPVAVIVCGDVTVSEKFWVHDCAAAAENLLLAANALGLGTVWTAAYDDEREKLVREYVGLPSNIRPLCVIPVGHPAEFPEPKDKWNPENIHHNNW